MADLVLPCCRWCGGASLQRKPLCARCQGRYYTLRKALRGTDRVPFPDDATPADWARLARHWQARAASRPIGRRDQASALSAEVPRG